MPEEYLLIRYHEGEVSPEEKALVEEWLNASADHQEEFEDLVNIWKHSSDASFFERLDVQADWAKIKEQAVSTGKIRSLSSQPPLWKRYWWAAAAVGLLLVIGGIRFWPQSPTSLDWQLAERTEATDPKLFQLADGSEVWLNVGSKLSYPTQFAGKERTVKLEGEGFFNIARNPEKPFIIEAGRSRTKVLGTAFTLEAYEEMGEVRLQVSEGKVEFSSVLPGGGKLILTEGQQAKVNLVGQVEKIEIPTHEAPAWKTGHFRFKNQPLELILLDLESFYECSFVWDEQALGLQCPLTLALNGESIDEILEELAATVGLAYQKSGKIIFIQQASCEGS